MNRVLIVEDEPRLASFIDKGLRASGFSTAIASEGLSATAMARDEDFDLVLLDLGLPNRSGLEVLADLRTAGQQLPVIILTALDDVSDKVAGLEAGADDYITKPFRFEELLARIGARLRPGSKAEVQTLEVGDIVLDLHGRSATIGTRTVELSAREFGLLETFMRHPNRILSREQLLSHVWGYNHDPGSNVVDVYVRYLRQKVGADRIDTVRGAGYRLIA